MSGLAVELTVELMERLFAAVPAREDVTLKLQLAVGCGAGVLPMRLLEGLRRQPPVRAASAPATN